MKRHAKKQQPAEHQPSTRSDRHFEERHFESVTPHEPVWHQSASLQYSVPEPELDSSAEGERAIVTPDIVQETPTPVISRKRAALRKAIIMGEILKPKFDNCEI